MSNPTSSRNKSGGVLPINAAVTKKQMAKSGNRGPMPKLRLIVRRLPPGLVESEFWAVMGEEWHVGAGKIDWATFKDGKVSKDPAKPSRPARAYLKVKDQSLLEPLSSKVRSAVFQDARGTTKDPCLIGPPSLEFAPYNKLASGRVRHDGRQGTIDQDQEFVDFLQSLTEPIVKSMAVPTDADVTQTKVTMTPLVQYLKDKKANKAKEAAEKKTAKQRDVKDAKEAKENKAATLVIKGAPGAGEKARVTKATQEAVAAINKSMASLPGNKSTSQAAKAPVKQEPPIQKPAVTQTGNATPSSARRERERGNAIAAARMLQRDLGLSPRSPRAARTGAAGAAPSKTEGVNTGDKILAATTSSDQATNAATTPAAAAPPTGPRNSQNISASASKPAPATPIKGPVARPAKSLPIPSTGAKSAFLKHANPSQGVTEELLRVAFEAFGTVLRCEIDKKKGLGYIDFADTETLRKAMHASPVKVGNGNVVVLENRNAKRAQPQTNAPGSGSKPAPTAVNSAVQNTTIAPPAQATASDTTSPVPGSAVPVPQAQSVPSPTTASLAPTAATPPTAPRVNSRGGSRGGSMRGSSAQRGNFAPSTRGGTAGPRGGFRGGRSNFGQRGGRGAAQAGAGNVGNGQSAGQVPPPTSDAASRSSGAGVGEAK